MNKEIQKKINIEELKGLLDISKDIPIAQLPPPEGISKEIIDAVKNPEVDNKLYKYEDLAEKIQKMPNIPKITTGISELDELLDGGLEPSELIVLSAITSQGKSSFARTMSYLQGLEKIPTLWFTLEESWQELTRNFMLMDSVFKKDGKASSLPIYYPIDNTALSLEWLEKQIIKAKKLYGVKMVYIDHLHFLVPLGTSKSNVSFLVGGIVAEIKKIAIRQDLSILLIAHTAKMDINVMPDINAPRDSSFISQYCNFLITLWREPIKQKRSEDVMENEDIFTDRTILTLVKNRRNGKTKKIALGMWNGRFYPYMEYIARRSETHMQDRNEDLDKVKERTLTAEQEENIEKIEKNLFD